MVITLIYWSLCRRGERKDPRGMGFFLIIRMKMEIRVAYNFLQIQNVFLYSTLDLLLCERLNFLLKFELRNSDVVNLNLRC